MVGIEVGDIEDVPALISRHPPGEYLRIVDQFFDDAPADAEQVDDLQIAIS